jgi:hypothetical protein
MEYHACGKESLAGYAQSKQRQHDFQSTALFKQVTKANKNVVTTIKSQRSKNKCPSVYKVYLVDQLGLDIKDNLKYNKVNN